MNDYLKTILAFVLGIPVASYFLRITFQDLYNQTGEHFYRIMGNVFSLIIILSILNAISILVCKKNILILLKEI